MRRQQGDRREQHQPVKEKHKISYWTVLCFVFFVDVTYFILFSYKFLYKLWHLSWNLALFSDPCIRIEGISCGLEGLRYMCLIFDNFPDLRPFRNQRECLFPIRYFWMLCVIRTKLQTRGCQQACKIRLWSPPDLIPTECFEEPTTLSIPYQTLLHFNKLDVKEHEIALLRNFVLHGTIRCFFLPSFASVGICTSSLSQLLQPLRGATSCVRYELWEYVRPSYPNSPYHYLFFKFSVLHVTTMPYYHTTWKLHLRQMRHLWLGKFLIILRCEVVPSHLYTVEKYLSRTVGGCHTDFSLYFVRYFIWPSQPAIVFEGSFRIMGNPLNRESFCLHFH